MVANFKPRSIKDWQVLTGRYETINQVKNTAINRFLTEACAILDRGVQLGDTDSSRYFPISELARLIGEIPQRFDHRYDLGVAAAKVKLDNALIRARAKHGFFQYWLDNSTTTLEGLMRQVADVEAIAERPVVELYSYETLQAIFQKS